MPQVSIIVPVFNAHDTLERCVNSVLTQTVGDWELILVDNCSTDHSYELIEEYARNNRQIRALKESTPGVSFARNAALEIAKGKYVCFVDSDDEIEPHYLESLLSDPEADLTLCGYYVDNETSDFKTLNSQSHIPDRVFWKRGESPTVLTKAFENGYVHLCCNKLFRREIVDDHAIRFEAYPVNEDYIFTLTYLLYANSISIVNKPLYHWKRIVGKVTGVKSIPDNLLDIYNHAHKLCRLFFHNNVEADRISYYSYEMIIYKFYEAIRKSRLTSNEGFARLRELGRNALVIDSFSVYKPSSNGEKILNMLMRNGWFKLHFLITQRILK